MAGLVFRRRLNLSWRDDSGFQWPRNSHRQHWRDIPPYLRGFTRWWSGPSRQQTSWVSRESKGNPRRPAVDEGVSRPDGVVETHGEGPSRRFDGGLWLKQRDERVFNPNCKNYPEMVTLVNFRTIFAMKGTQKPPVPPTDAGKPSSRQSIVLMGWRDGVYTQQFFHNFKSMLFRF